MQDVDASIGIQAFAQNSGERLFLEYAPDAWEKRASRIRTFGVIAMFDRKRSFEAIVKTPAISTAFYLYLCRSLGDANPGRRPARFFYVVGGDAPPWTMIELSTTTGDEIGERVTIASSTDWRTVWNAVGLRQVRDEFTAWLR